MKLCNTCLDNAYRRARLVEIITDKELRNPTFLTDFRAFTSSLNIKPKDWPDYALDIYRDFDGFITDHERHLISLNTEHLEVYEDWYDEWVNTPVPPGVIARPRKESRARIRVLATILKTEFPGEAATWGGRPANDNEPQALLRLVK